MFNIKPKDDMFFLLFSEGVSTANKASKELKALTEDLSNPDEHLKTLTNLEHEGDRITHKLVEHTKKMFITPLDREDIYTIAKAIDSITDNIESTAYRFFMYNIFESNEETTQVINKIVDATEELVIAVAELKHLNKSKIILEKIISINRIENEADLIYRKAVKKLFDDPDDLLKVIKWKDLYKYLEDTIDCCELLANEIQGVVMKYV